MSGKSPQSGQAKKQDRTVKEKRADKRAKTDESLVPKQRKGQRG